MADGPPTAVCASAQNGGEGAAEALVNLRVAPEAAQVLVALARGDELLATKEVVERCRERFEWKPTRDRTLRGVATAVAVYTLVSDKPIASIQSRLPADRT